MVTPSYGALLDAVRGVRWPARRPVAGAVTGMHPSRARGTAAEFSEFRAYRQGDDPRRLDWKLLARSDRAYVRLATERAILPTTIVIDASASMAFPAKTLAKWALARELAVALAAIAQAGGDPAGLCVAASGRRVRLPARSRRGVVAEMIRALDHVTPAGSPAVTDAFTDARTPRIAVITDLLGDADTLLRAATMHVAAGGEVHLVHVIAEEELHPGKGLALVTDPERPDDERLLERETLAEYEQRFAAWRSDAARAWLASGSSYTVAVTSESAARIARRITERPAAAHRV